MKKSPFLNANFIPALTTYECRGYIISAWARPESANGSTSVGIVYERSQLGSIIQVQRIEGKLFQSKEQAEQHGLKLCKEWIDKQQTDLTVVLAEKLTAHGTLRVFTQLNLPLLRSPPVSAINRAGKGG